MLFYSQDNKTEIFISLWVWCPTWCQWCQITNQKVRFKSLQDMRKSLDFINLFFDKNFSIFLYSTDNLKNPNLQEILTYLGTIWRKFRVQIPINSKKQDLENLKTGKNNEFIISKKIFSKEDFIMLIQSIKDFHKQNDFIINYDILLEKKFIKALEKILKTHLLKNSDLTYSKRINDNIFMNIRELYNINYKQEKVENLKISSCFSLESFEVQKNYILIKDHIEIDEEWNLTFHNPLCYLWNHKISNLKRSTDYIISDFIKYKTHLEKLNYNFEKNCYKCVKIGYNYQKN